MNFIIEKDKNKIKDIVINLGDDLFNKNISIKKLTELSDKFSKHAIFLVGINKLDMIGYASFYCNDSISKKAFISIIVIKHMYQHQGYGKMFINEILKISRNAGMSTLNLQVDKGNVNAITFYKRNGFNICFEDNKTYIMTRDI